MKGSVKKVFEMLSELFGQEAVEKDSVAMLIENAKNEIRAVRARLDAATDEEVIEMYLFRLKSAENEYRELLKMAKQSKEKKTG